MLEEVCDADCWAPDPSCLCHCTVITLCANAHASMPLVAPMQVKSGYRYVCHTAPAPSSSWHVTLLY